MMTPLVESVVRIGLVRNESAPTRADSMSAAAFTLKRFMPDYNRTDVNKRIVADARSCDDSSGCLSLGINPRRIRVWISA